MESILILIVLISCSYGSNIFENLQAHVEPEKRKVVPPNGHSESNGEGKREDYASREIDYDVIDDEEVQAKILGVHRAPGNIKGSADTVIPVAILEYVASWLHPAPPHHQAKHSNKSLNVKNLGNQTYMKEPAKNKTIATRITHKSAQNVPPDKNITTAAIDQAPAALPATTTPKTSPKNVTMTELEAET